MKTIYVPHYDNGESYDDYYDWYSDYGYSTEEEAEKEIFHFGFVEDDSGWSQRRKKEDGITSYIHKENKGYTDPKNADITRVKVPGKFKSELFQEEFEI